LKQTGKLIYLATCALGLEFFLVRELGRAGHQVELLWQEPGRVCFAAEGLPASRIASKVCVYAGTIGGFSLAEGGERELAELAARLPLEAAALSACKLLQAPARPTFRVTCSREGGHAYSSEAIAAAVGAVWCKRFDWPVRLKGFDVEVLVLVKEDVAHIALVVADETSPPRLRKVHAPASLNPHVAWAMAQAVPLRKRSVVVDPMCGAGTLLVAAGNLQPRARLVGGDLDPAVPRLARTNLRASALSGFVGNWDATCLPLARASADVVLCNLPFGRRVGSHRQNKYLYPAFLAEVERILKPGAFAALLSSELGLLVTSLERRPRLAIRNLWRLSTGGLRPALVLVERLA